MRKLLMVFLFVGLIVTGCSSSNSTSSEKDSKSLDYPTRQIELVVPFSAGGGVDLAARAVAEYLSKEWGEPIVVTNKTGGGGIIGGQFALKEAKADGYTVLVNNNSSTSFHVAGTSKPTLTLEDNIFAARVASGSVAFAVKADAKWDSIKDFTNWVKTNPEKLTWASVGPTGLSSFAVAEWLEAIGVDYKKTKMVSSEGASDSSAKVAGGHVILAAHTVGEFAPLLDAGKIKLLAVQSPERNPLYPEVPTFTEEGINGLTVKWWTGLSFAKGTPKEIVTKWDKAIEKMEKDEEFLNQLEKIKLEPAYLNANNFTKDVQNETEEFTKLAEKTGIRE